ncbi:transglutaminase-like domain-containing protein [Thermococcus sp.]
MRGRGSISKTLVATLAVFLVLVLIFSNSFPAEKLRKSISSEYLPKAKEIVSHPSCGDVHSLERALECYLNDQTAMKELGNLALQLKGKDVAESAWNVVEWEDSHISYDSSKSPASPIQRPIETVQRGRGICVDYAVLTAALLIEMNYSPVYVLDINFSNSPTGHAATAIRINGTYFVLDQHPPVMDLGTYWKYWAYWNNGSPRGNLEISGAVVYEVKKVDGSVTVRSVGKLTAQDFLSEDYSFTADDAHRVVVDLLAVLLKRHPNLHLDRKISNLDESKILPPGYSSGKTWMFSFPLFGEYYNPVFHREFVDYVYRNIASKPSLVEDLKSYSHVWVKDKLGENGKLVVIINLAK